MLSCSIIPFDNKINRKNFHSTSDELNHYLKTQVSQDIKRRISSCFLDLTDDNELAGYYTLSSTSLDLSDLSDELQKKLPRYPTVPAVLMGRLAIDTNYQGKKLGSMLLIDALKRCINAEIACYALIVEEKNQQAVAFYQKFGFIAFKSKADKLYYPLANLPKA